MKLIGYTFLKDMLCATESENTVYMRSTVKRSRGGSESAIVWLGYQIMVQVEKGENILYWMIDLGSEPEGIPNTRPESKDRLCSSAEAVIKLYLSKNFDLSPDDAMISFPADTVLYEGTPNDFMRFNKELSLFEAL